METGIKLISPCVHGLLCELECAIIREVRLLDEAVCSTAGIQNVSQIRILCCTNVRLCNISARLMFKFSFFPEIKENPRLINAARLPSCVLVRHSGQTACGIFTLSTVKLLCCICHMHTLTETKWNSCTCHVVLIPSFF